MEEKKSKITLKKVDGQWILTVPWRHIGTYVYPYPTFSAAHKSAMDALFNLTRNELA